MADQEGGAPHCPDGQHEAEECSEKVGQIMALHKCVEPELIDGADEAKALDYQQCMVDWAQARAQREGPVILHGFKFGGASIAPAVNDIVTAGQEPNVSRVTAAGMASCYYPINPSQEPASLKTSKHHVIEVRRLGVDLDVNDHEDTPKNLDDLRTNQALADRLSQHQLEGRRAIVSAIDEYAKRHGKPTTCVDSGGGFQLLFDLNQPVELPPGNVNDHGELLREDGAITTKPGECALSPERETIIADVEARNLGLIERFDAIVAELHVSHLVKVDRTQNIDRVFRTPWTANRPDKRKQCKGRKPAWARLVFQDRTVTYALDSFPRAATPAKKSGGRRSEVNIPSGDVKRVPIEELQATLEQYGFTDQDDIFRLIDRGYDSEAAPMPGKDHSGSGMLLRVCGELVRHEVPDGLIYAIVTDEKYGISKHPRSQGRGMNRAVKRAIGKAKQDQDADEGDSRAPVEHAFAANLDKLGVTLEYDEFRDQIGLAGLAGFGPTLDDAAMRRLRFKFSTVTEENKIPQKELFAELCLNHARYHSRHLVREYLDDVQGRWDGVPRVDTWLIDYLGAEDTPFNRAVGSIFLVAAVRRIRKPGCKFDELLVLEGPTQGHGKSTILKRLAVNEDWFSDDMPLNADGKRVIEQTGGKWIIECGELKGMRQGDIESLKSTMSRTHDRGRLAYARLVSDVPRSWVGAGTTNNRKYLKDQTGNRRFWPVETGDIDLIAFTREVVDQLWAEAATLEAEGESIRLDPELYDAAAAVQGARTADDPIVEKLESVMDGLDNVCVTTEDLWAILGARDATRRQQWMNDRMGETMRRLGFERKQRRINGGRPYVYQRGSQEPPHVPARFSPDDVFLGWGGINEPEDGEPF